LGLFTPTKERKIQLYLRDDRKFQFTPRLLEHTCLVKKEGDIIKIAWKHFYATELPFGGYKKLHPSMVTLGFGRDIILDIFNKVPVSKEANSGEKPERTADSIKKWIAKIGENQRHYYRVKRKTSFLNNRIVLMEMGVIAIMIIGWAIRFATN